VLGEGGVVLGWGPIEMCFVGSRLEQGCLEKSVLQIKERKCINLGGIAGVLCEDVVA